MTKTIKIIFLIACASIILLPLAFLNLNKDALSTLDKRRLSEMPNSIEDFRLNGEKFLQDRIGFRNNMIVLYHDILSNVFGQLDHPLFSYFKDGHVFFSYDNYIKSYQNNDIDLSILDRNIKSLLSMQNYLKQNNCYFIFASVPDKKTVYSEFFSSDIHKKNIKSFRELMLSQMQLKKINYIDFTDILIEKKQDYPTYNKYFDAGHFNAYGAFIVHQALTDRLKKDLDQNIDSLSIKDFDFSKRDVELLPYLNINKTESVPSINTSLSLDIIDQDGIKIIENPNAKIDSCIMIFGDSYFLDCDCYYPHSDAHLFYANNFKKVVLAKSIWGKDIKSLYEKYKPNLLIYEVAERVLHGDVLNWIDLK